MCAVSSFYCYTITVWPLSICLYIHTVHTNVPLSLLTYVHIHTHAHAHTQHNTTHTHAYTQFVTMLLTLRPWATKWQRVCWKRYVCVSVCLSVHAQTYICMPVRVLCLVDVTCILRTLHAQSPTCVLIPPFPLFLPLPPPPPPSPATLGVQCVQCEC